jgi:hypothetical protein
MTRLDTILSFLVLIGTVATVSGNRWKPASFVSAKSVMDGPSIELVSVDDASVDDVSVKYGSDDDISVDGGSVDDASADNVSVDHDSDSSSMGETRPLVNQISRGGDDDSSSEEGKATILSSVFNLVNNVAGAGILTLAAGMAPGTGLIPAMLICALLGVSSGHCFSIIGKACELTGESDFKVRECA